MPLSCAGMFICCMSTSGTFLEVINFSQDVVDINLDVYSYKHAKTYIQKVHNKFYL